MPVIFLLMAAIFVVKVVAEIPEEPAELVSLSLGSSWEKFRMNKTRSADSHGLKTACGASSHNKVPSFKTSSFRPVPRCIEKIL